MRVHYHTFGCKANQYDTERMRQEAEARGSETSEDVSDASTGSDPTPESSWPAAPRRSRKPTTA